jgi:hypothetical protein
MVAVTTQVNASAALAIMEALATSLSMSRLP